MTTGTTSAGEKLTFTCPHTGAAVTRYTTEGTSNQTLYFTNSSYTGNDDHIIFTSDRTGREELHLVERAGGRIVQLTDGDSRAGWHAAQHPSRAEAYYTDGRVVKRVRYDTLKRETLMEAPEGMRVGMFNFNCPPWLVFHVVEETRGGATGLDHRAAHHERLLMRPLTLIYRLNVDTGEAACVWGDLKLLTHVQLSPVDENLLIFSSWRGYGEPRVQYLDVSGVPMTTPRPLCPESDTARGGHEAFTRGGNLYLQWMEGDLRPGRDHQLYHGFQHLRDVPTGRAHEGAFTRFAVPDTGDSMVHHFTMSLDESWGLHDRWLGAPTWDDNLNFLSVFRHQADEPQTVAERVCFTNCRWEYDKPGCIGPNASLSHDDGRAAFTSYEGRVATVCEVDLRPFVDRLRGGS